MNQLPSGTITMKQTKYVNAIPPISMKTERKNQGEEPVTEEERQKLRALIGSLQYAAVHTRPDLSSRLSQLQPSINRATVNTISFANQTLHEAKKHSDTTIQIQAIPVDDFRFLAFSDASFASKGNPSSHTGCMIMGTHKLISQNVSCPVSPLSWGSKKIQRVVTSTLAAETVSLSSVLDHLSWLRLCWGWMLDPSVQWKQPSDALLKLPETYSTATYRTQHLPGSLAATDCKSLYDLVTRTAVPNCSEYRTQLNARAIKDFLAEGVQLRWVHSGAQLADSLTKIMENSFLRATLHHGHYKLHDELEVLKSRATTRNRLRWLKGSEQKESNDQGCNDECLLSINNWFLGVWIPHHCNWSWVTRTFTHSRSAPSSIPGWYVHLSTLAQGTIGEVSGRDSFWCLLAIGLLHLDLVDVVVLESQGLYPVLVRRLISPLQSCFDRSAESLGTFASAGVSLEKRRVPALWCLGGRSCQVVAVYDPSTMCVYIYIQTSRNKLPHSKCIIGYDEFRWVPWSHDIRWYPEYWIDHSWIGTWWNMTSQKNAIEK